MQVRKKLIYVNVLISIAIVSCKKFVEIDPPKTQLISNTVFANETTATASMISIYGLMERNSTYFFSLYPGLSADELADYSTNTTSNEFSKNSLSTTNVSIGSNFWNAPYQYIYAANAIIEGLINSTTVKDGVKNQLIGEAKFTRAFWNFYLVNLFGDVPLTLSTDFNTNKVAYRKSKAVVYEQIINDLKDAQNMLSESYVKADNTAYPVSSSERIRPNKSAATALLARTYLYLSNWSDAEIQANSIIVNTSLYSLVQNLDDVFLKNSTEAIWQLMPTLSSINTQEGNQYILTGTPGSSTLSTKLINSFEIGDARKASWINFKNIGTNNYYYPFKYKIKAISPGQPYLEYSMVLRLAEQYLIRAEARAQQNNLSAAKIDVNIIRSRAGLAPVTTNDKDSLLTVILHERQVELFCEWGHRWLDLKRDNMVDAILIFIKAPNWQTTDQLYPIPNSEILNNPNLIQNPGY